MKKLILMALTLGLISNCGIVYSDNTMDPLKEYRYCGVPKRDAGGDIYRSYRVYAAFRKIYPCPSTGLTAGRCDGWQVDHVRPLASCGGDAVSNMQWLPVEIKTCAGALCKDRWERTVYTCTMTQEAQ